MFPLTRTHFIDVFKMAYVKITTVCKLKMQQKHTVYKDKSEARKKW